MIPLRSPHGLRMRPFLAALGLMTALLFAACESQPTSPEKVDTAPVIPPPSSTSEVIVRNYPAQCWFDRTFQLGFYPPETLAQIAECDLSLIHISEPTRPY